jgi:hypothetical protein
MKRYGMGIGEKVDKGEKGRRKEACIERRNCTAAISATTTLIQ